MTRNVTPLHILAFAIAGLLAACSSSEGDSAPARDTVTSTAQAVAVRDPTTTTPATAATVTVAPVATPEELVDRWVGPPRQISTLGTGTAAAFVAISEGFLEYETGIADNPKAFASDVVPTAADVIEVKLDGDVLDCIDGALGHYRWSLSPQATTLALTAVDDACGARKTALEGNWTHTACRLKGRDCIGAVEAGTYSTNRWNPYGGFTYGEATFALPDGWAVTYDSQAALFIGLASDYAKSPDPDPWGLRAWADVAAAAPDSDDCSKGPTDQPDQTVGPGAENIATWMAALPTLQARRSTMTIGGLDAEVVDAEVAAGASICDWGIVLIVSRTSDPDPFNYGIVAGQHMRVILVDVLPERTVAIFMDDSGHPGFDALEKVATPIVESFVFSPTPPAG